MPNADLHIQVRERTQVLFGAIDFEDPAAVQAFFDQYAPLFLVVIRARMTPKLRCIFDSVDFLQETRMKLQGCALDKKDFESPEAFIGFIQRIAERQVLQALRKQARRSHGDPNHEKPIDGLAPQEAAQLVDRSPDPLEVEIAEERWRRAVEKLPPVYRHIAMRFREGYRQAEIAREMGLHEMLVSRVIKKLRAALMEDEES